MSASKFCTHPKDNVVAEEQVFVPTADFCIRISVIVHLLWHSVCTEEKMTGLGKDLMKKGGFFPRSLLLC